MQGESHPREPPHPGQVVRERYLEPQGLKHKTVAPLLGLSPSRFSRFLNGHRHVDAPLAFRLASVFGGSPESWFDLHRDHALWAYRREHGQPARPLLEPPREPPIVAEPSRADSRPGRAARPRSKVVPKAVAAAPGSGRGP